MALVLLGVLEICLDSAICHYSQQLEAVAVLGVLLQVGDHSEAHQSGALCDGQGLDGLYHSCGSVLFGGEARVWFRVLQ